MMDTPRESEAKKDDDKIERVELVKKDRDKKRAMRNKMKAVTRLRNKQKDSIFDKDSPDLKPREAKEFRDSELRRKKKKMKDKIKAVARFKTARK